MNKTLSLLIFLHYGSWWLIRLAAVPAARPPGGPGQARGQAVTVEHLHSVEEKHAPGTRNFHGVRMFHVSAAAANAACRAYGTSRRLRLASRSGNKPPGSLCAGLTFPGYAGGPW